MREMEGNVEGRKLDRAWWQKPGLGIMYQIEFRPGWKWNRNFDKFNASMIDEKGRFRFNGPYCKIADWVALSSRIGADYHVFEVKWHDGVVWFDSSLTDWKTPTDYAAQFADLSRKAGIPFVFYYSALIDHNPRFRNIIPLNRITPSFPVMRGDVYKNYLEGQMKEIVDKYNPDGMWFDWSTMGVHPSEWVVIDFLKEYSPSVVITFNNSAALDAGPLHSFLNPFIASALLEAFFHHLFFEQGKPVKKDTIKKLHYVTWEAHSVGSAWKKSNLYRRLNRPWELVSPAGRWWDNIALRDDLYDLLRMAAMVMANGGKYAIGVAAQMDGNIYPDHIRQLELVGEWYRPRRELFTEATPMDYRGQRIPGVSGYGKHMRAVGSRQGNDHLIHLFNLAVDVSPVKLWFDLMYWSHIDRIYLEPGNMELTLERTNEFAQVTIPASSVDRIDTILRVTSR